MKEYTHQQLLSLLSRSRKIFTVVLLLFAFFPTQSFGAADETDITLTVFFCNSDLVCDAEENSDSCPSDCAATSTPPAATSTSQTGGGGSGGGVGFGPLPNAPQPPVDDSVTTVVPPLPSGDGGGAVSSDPTWGSVDPFWSSSFFVSVDEVRDNIYFYWQSGSFVRILRSEDKFPISPVEGGIIVYEGKAGVFIDTFLLPGTYYYSIFPMGANGSYSGRQLALVQIVEKTIKISEKEQDLVLKMRFLYNLIFIFLFLVALYIIWRFYLRFLI